MEDSSCEVAKLRITVIKNQCIGGRGMLVSTITAIFGSIPNPAKQASNWFL